MGLIVKLKDAKPQSVVRLKASALPSDGAGRQRARLADAARRKRVSYLVQRPTAFAANVIHAGHPVPWAEANAEAERLRTDPDVEWVVVNEFVKRQSLASNNIPDDPGYLVGDTNSPNTGSGQVWLQSRGGANLGLADFPGGWSFINTWSQSHTLQPVVVAVLDTGILPHPDLAGRLLQGYDFVSRDLAAGDGNGVDSDPTDEGDWVSGPDAATLGGGCTAEPFSSWHGLGIAGMLAANTDNFTDGAGILAQLKGPGGGSALLMPVRVAGKCGAIVSDIIEGMLWAAKVSYQGAPALPTNRARVINLSFGGDGACSSSDPTGQLYLQTIATLANNGVLVVAAAGNGDNSGNPGYVAPALPANCPGVLAVTALNQQGYKASYANMVSDGVAVAAGDGGDAGIYTTDNTGTTIPSSIYGMTQWDGTSFAAPQAAGVAAMMLAVNPSLSVQQLLDLIKSTSIHAFPSGAWSACDPNVPQANCACRTSAPLTCGSGILNAPQAIAAAEAATGAGLGTPTTSVSYFTPNRAIRPASGGGGGALDWWSLCALGGIATLGAFRFKTGRP